MATPDNGAYVKAKIISVGTVTTAKDGFTPIVSYWNMSYEGVPVERQAPTFDSERHSCWGWPIHELAAMAAVNAR